jgi:hypothetical protein
MDKIRMIETSFRVFRFGWLAFIPVVGIVFSLIAIYLFTRVFYFAQEDWNPARSHLYVGGAAALLSALIHGIAVAIPLSQLAPL